MIQITGRDNRVGFGDRFVANDNEYVVNGNQYVNRRATDLSQIEIRDDFLKMAVGIKLEAGVRGSEIWSVIDEFVLAEQSPKLGNRPLAYLWVDQIPQERRNAFLTALAALSSPATESPIEPRIVAAESMSETPLSSM